MSDLSAMANAFYQKGILVIFQKWILVLKKKKKVIMSSLPWYSDMKEIPTLIAGLIRKSGNLICLYQWHLWKYLRISSEYPCPFYLGKLLFYTPRCTLLLTMSTFPLTRYVHIFNGCAHFTHVSSVTVNTFGFQTIKALLRILSPLKKK